MKAKKRKKKLQKALNHANKLALRLEQLEMWEPRIIVEEVQNRIVMAAEIEGHKLKLQGLPR